MEPLIANLKDKEVIVGIVGQPVAPIAMVPFEPVRTVPTKWDANWVVKTQNWHANIPIAIITLERTQN